MDAADSHTTLVYRIDAGDRLSYVNAAWCEFARANGGDAVLPEVILGRPWLAAISDVTVREIYLRILRRVRDGVPVSFQFRCDAPDRRRRFAMHVALCRTGEVEFTSALRHEETRPAVELLGPAGPRSDRMVRICSWCQKLAVPADRWLPVEEAIEILGLMQHERLPVITHGICEPCSADMMGELQLI